MCQCVKISIYSASGVICGSVACINLDVIWTYGEQLNAIYPRVNVTHLLGDATVCLARASDQFFVLQILLCCKKILFDPLILSFFLFVSNLPPISFDPLLPEVILFNDE